MSDELEKIDRFFEDLGIQTFARFVDDPDWMPLTDEDITSYATMAAMRWYGPRLIEVPGGHSDLMPLAMLFVRCLAKALSGEGCTEEGGRVYIEEDGERVEVTERSMRHWEWMLGIFGNRDLAERYLALVPEAVRADAMGRVNGVVAEQFDSIVTGGADA